MCALYFVGLGIYGDKGISLLGIEVIKQCEVAYFESYTSPVQTETAKSLSVCVGREVRVVSREFVEDGRTIIDQSMKNDVALITPGDPMMATTHMDLRVRAKRKGVKTQVIHGSSIFSVIPGETGLHAYKFGKTVTITRSPNASLATVYDTVYENLVRGLHTLLLLEYNSTTDLQLTPKDAFKSLIEYEEDFHLGIFKPDTFAVAASRLGSTSQSTIAGDIRFLLNQEYGDPPYALVIPGELHFTEVDALKTILDVNDTQIHSNSNGVQGIAASMVERYVEKTERALRDALTKVGESGKKGLHDLFENVECYLSDSKRFLNQGKDELAILSIGYAEGLLDSLRYTQGLELNW